MNNKFKKGDMVFVSTLIGKPTKLAGLVFTIDKWWKDEDHESYYYQSNWCLPDKHGVWKRIFFMEEDLMTFIGSEEVPSYSNFDFVEDVLDLDLRFVPDTTKCVWTPPKSLDKED